MQLSRAFSLSMQKGDSVEIPEVTTILETPTLDPSHFEPDGELNLLHTELNYRV